MNKVPNHPWWSMSPIKPGETRDDDYADMGTAFGLDASLTPPVEPPAEPEIERIDLNAPVPPHDRLNGRSVI
ncbi:MAG: hypothetical protein E6H58_03610 [Betaproteobacteria bacterium]|nr:MAG: hypothetical protein E6H65_12040 [Betaproteobacteria bacterium]TMH35570.1 MAG: hypothetical protein E6H58_03610 [Betaproteobacteria bacterium]